MQIDEQKRKTEEPYMNMEEQKTKVKERNEKMLEQNTEMKEQNAMMEEYVLLLEEQHIRMQQQNREMEEQNAKIEEHVLLIEEHNLSMQNQNTEMEEHNVEMLEHNAKMLEQNVAMEEYNVRMLEQNVEMEEHNTRMKEHIMLMQETNSKMKEHNLKMEQKNIEKEEQNVDCETTSSSGCTSSIKAFWSRSAWLRTAIGIFVMDIALYSYDIYSDVCVVIDLYQRGHTGLFSASLTFVIFPMLLTNWTNLVVYIKDDLKKSRFRLQDITFKHIVETLPMHITPLYAVYLGFLRMKNRTEYTTEHIRMKDNELFYEAGPQLILQIYIVTTLPLTSYYIYFGSILASLLSVFFGWSKFIALIMIARKNTTIRKRSEIFQKLAGQTIRSPTLMETLRCSLIYTLWDTLLFFFLALIIIPPFPLFGHIVVFTAIQICVEINFPTKTMKEHLIGKIVFYFVWLLTLSAFLYLLQEPSEKCIIGHNTCYFSKLSSRVDVNVTFCPYELNATSTDINCCHNNVFSEDIVLYYIPAAFTLVGLSTMTLAIEYSYSRFKKKTYKDFILIADNM